MTLARGKHPATYQDVLDAPEHVVAEILNGELFLSPRPSLRHARAASRLAMRLAPFDDPGPQDPGGWLILLEPELHFEAQVLVPDLAGWRRARMPELPDLPWSELAPDWVCEVASPSTQRTDRMLKMPVYRQAGVEWVWLVDPGSELVEVFHGQGDKWVLESHVAGAGAIRLPPFDAVELDPGAWFPR
jgi:Uma2 family endonuclease